jgi:hypothetical protein
MLATVMAVTGPVLWEHLRTYWLCGLAGGIVHDLMMNHGCLTLPHYNRERREMNLGTLGSAAIGIASAIFADNSPVVAFASSIVGATALREAVLRYLGYSAKRRTQRRA